VFTGIITHVGRVEALEQVGGDVRLSIGSSGLPIDELKMGESIATNGVCLTVTDKLADGFAADVSTETLKLTTIGDWEVGKRVNLERSLSLSDRLGGHMVSGHVDGTGVVLERRSTARAEHFVLQAPEELARYIAHKGSITVDGVSLTVNAVRDNEFELTIVPHTLAQTIMGDYQEGSCVNLEVDMLARYLERLLHREQEQL
jgi:riboflavin synthase